MARGALSVLVLVLVLAPAGSARNDPDAKEWIQLFNGKDLDGWDIKITGHDLNDNFGDTFRVENGVLKIAYDQYGRSSTTASATSSTGACSRTTSSPPSTASSASRRRARPTGRSATAASWSTPSRPRA